MQTQQTEIVDIGSGKRRGRPPKSLGRKDADGQEKVIEISVIKDRIDTLVELYNAAGEAAAAYGDGIKAAAEKSGLLSTTVRKFVQARASEDFAEAARRVTQLALIFEEVGE